MAIPIVVVDNSDFTGANEFLSVFEKYWSITKSVQFIKSVDISGVAKPGDSFFSLTSSKRTGGTSGGFANTYRRLVLWRR